MTMVTMIIGMPGSGKTYLAKELLHRHGGLLIDDLSQHVDEKYFAIFCNTRASRIFITDPWAAMRPPEKITEKLRGWFGDDIEVVFIAFENDVDACLANCVLRNDGRIISRNTLEMISRAYNTALYDDVRPVYGRDGNA